MSGSGARAERNSAPVEQTGEHAVVSPSAVGPLLRSLAAAERACDALLTSRSQHHGLGEVAQRFLEIFAVSLVVIDWFDPSEPVRGAAPHSSDVASWWAPWQSTTNEGSTPLTVMTVPPAERKGVLATTETLLIVELAAGGRRGAVGVGYPYERHFSADELTTWTILADHLALALSSTGPRERERDSSTRARSTDEIVSIAAHELRTPLTPITMLLQSLERKAKGGTIDLDGIVRTTRQVQRLTRMISDLLDLTRLRRGRLALTPEPLALTPTVEEAVRVFRETNQKNELQLALPEEPLEVIFDRERLQHAMTAWLEHLGRVIPAAQPIRITIERRGLFASLALQGTRPGSSLDATGSAEREQAKAASLALAVHLADELTAHYGGSVVIDGACGERVTARLPLHEARQAG